jgi:hypothetical protein
MKKLDALILASMFFSSASLAKTIEPIEGIFSIPGGEISFKDRSENLKVPGADGTLGPHRGQTWSISWGDANNNLWPDLYLNHHTNRSTGISGYPKSHLIFDPGRESSNKTFLELGGGDQHTAIFIDINGDAQQDIFEIIGGRRGQAKITNAKTWNNVFLSENGRLKNRTVADDFGLSYPAARGRTPVPFIFQNRLALIVTNAPREDRLYPTSVFVHGRDGKYHIRPSVLQARYCLLGLCFGSEPADLDGYQLAVTGHLDSDDNLDILLARRSASPRSMVFWGQNSSDEFLSERQDVLDEIVRDIAVFDSDNDGDFELWFAGTGSGNNLLLLCWDERIFSKIRLANSIDENKTVGVVTGDLDNDTDVDVVTYETNPRNTFAISIWENNGSGRFTRHEFEDRSNLGRARNVAIADYNLDGALDLVFGDGKGSPEETQPHGGYILLEGMANNNWIEIDLRDSAGLRGLGARIEATAGETTMWRGQYGGVHSDAQDSIRLHFGLGESLTTDIRVIWDDGSISTRKAVAANQVVTISQDQ